MGSQCSTLIKLELWFIHNRVVVSFQMDGSLVGAGSHKPLVGPCYFIRFCCRD
jgi:hypothetical protein